jgi:asparagine synthase (glutamine-hydrolysing)
LSRLVRRAELLRRFGLRWVLYRAGYAFRIKTGLLKRRFPRIDLERTRLDDLVLSGTPTDPQAYVAFRETLPARFFFDAGKLPASAELSSLATQAGRRRTLEIADDYCRGRFLYYSRHVHDLGWPPDWLLNPLTGGRYDAARHWCDTPTFSPAQGDIKDVWEPSRFACAYYLVRAFAMTGDEKYPAAFWELFDSWRQTNPPNMGPNWKCGQETALRTMAWCFALYGFWRAKATTPRRVADIAKLIAVQADRIAGNIDYAISQKNNHALSEAVGLLTAGLLFPEFKSARRWESIGRRVLEQEVPRQVYADGSFVQQSMNYHRVMLHDCLWAIRLADLNGDPLSSPLCDRIGKAGEFLFEMLDPESGRVPNYGANDGALILPLAACDYLDYRPTVQTARYVATLKRSLPPGPWDEMLLWLNGKDAAAAPLAAETPTSSRFDAGGYYTLRSARSWCMVRCHTYRDRPAHVDMLHLDLWHDGINVLGDTGTYKYFTPDRPQLERSLPDISAHNTVEVDGAGPLSRVSRFIWMPWPKARCLEHRHNLWQGEHYAYNRPPWHVVHRRTVDLIGDDEWRITDELSGEGDHDVTLRWHLAEGEGRLDDQYTALELSLPRGRVLLTIEGPSGYRMRLSRGVADDHQVVGWLSEYYAELRPRPTLEVSVRGRMPIRLVTLLRFVDKART